MRKLAYGLTAGLIAIAAAAQAQSLPAAQTFVTGLYSAYQREPGADYLGREIRQVFTPDLIALIHREAAGVPKGDVGALDGDPICDCQDWRISDVRVTVSTPKPGAAEAEVRFQNAGQPQRVRLDLVAVQGRWRVADVHTPDMPSLTKLLRDSIVQNTPKAGRP
jgi:Protein of unknown function (DUF3828)